MNILSLFANIGVAEAYLEELGHSVKVANEIDAKRAKLYSEIYPNTKMVCGDIREDATYSEILQASKKNKVDLIMATPPCQGMSTAGKKEKADPRNDLFLYAVRLIQDLSPSYFLIENVPGFLSTHISLEGKQVLIPDVIKEQLGSNYDLQFSIANTQNYGVPQSRERMILLGSRKDKKHKWAMPAPHDKVVTMEDAIGWIPIIDPFVKDISVEEMKKLFPHYEERKEAALAISKWNIPTSHVLRNVIVMQHTPTGKTAFDNDVYVPRKKNGEIVKGFHNTYKRQNWDTPAYTVAMDNIEISSQNNVHPGRYLGKDQNGDDIYSDPRALTIYELMKIMSIPDNWNLPEDVNKPFLRHVIGEGVPSEFIREIFSEL